MRDDRGRGRRQRGWRRRIRGLIPLPGGVGGTDGGLIGAWSSTASRSPAPAAVVIYRTFQLGLPAILGAIALVQLRRSLRQSDTSAKLCAPLSDGAPERAAAG